MNYFAITGKFLLITCFISIGFYYMIYVVQKHEHKNVVIQSEQDNVHGDRHYCTDGQKDCYFNTDFFNDTYFNDDIDQDSTTHYDVDANSSTLLQD